MECAWFPISLLEMLQSSVSYFEVLTFFCWRKLQASPVLTASSVHRDMKTLSGWKTFKWLTLAPQVLKSVTHKSRKGNVTILTWCNVAQVLSLQLIISIKAEEARDSWGVKQHTASVVRDSASSKATDTPSKTFHSECPCFMETHLPHVQSSLAGKHSQPPPQYGCGTLTQSRIHF